MHEELQQLALAVGQALTARGWLLGSAESCTGGLLASVLTDAPGASAWFAGGVVAYANSVKRDVLGVSQAVLEGKGAVSREAVLAMARGARGVLGSEVSVAISGIAGPDLRRIGQKGRCQCDGPVLVQLQHDAGLWCPVVVVFLLLPPGDAAGLGTAVDLDGRFTQCLPELGSGSSRQRTARGEQAGGLSSQQAEIDKFRHAGEL